MMSGSLNGIWNVEIAVVTKSWGWGGRGQSFSSFLEIRECIESDVYFKIFCIFIVALFSVVGWTKPGSKIWELFQLLCSVQLYPQLVTFKLIVLTCRLLQFMYAVLSVLGQITYIMIWNQNQIISNKMIWNQNHFLKSLAKWIQIKSWFQIIFEII